MLVSDIVTRVRAIAGDSNSVQFTDATIITWLNDAQKIAAEKNQLLQKTASSNTVVGTSTYNLPADILKLHSVWYDGAKLPVYTFKEAEERANLADTSVGSPTFCYVWAGVLNLFPVPSRVVALKINYTQYPAELTLVSETPGLPVIYHQRLVDYCLAQVAQQDDNEQLYQLKMSEFNGGVSELKDVPEWENDQYPMITVGDRDRGMGAEDYW